MTADRTCVRWSRAEDAELLRLRDVARLDWPAIAAKLPGRSAAACEQRYYGKLKGARDRARRPRVPKPSQPVVSWRKRGAAIVDAAAEPVAAVPVVVPSTPPLILPKRMPSLDHLRERAELQLRIDRQGLTAGFFGDPPPGRSALDARARAAAAGVQLPSGRGGSDVR
ncbi:hypothetical protein PMI42_00726 [Bradyrhizobium sp. YR681]|uniref:SANT/Myb-like DNA-binding domain-containing protein n=1 Tax=Bradyrhizobium sp. YR681 TaxID=1144344 RepID=UPI000270E692|nr:SANT/Myb-like DNA-binding domain-containing protein [Bradyrhizobium sp. YR681]EJN15708.1 hypothetical protein PMI42_00726 [Bradyrhizobium sp. YR681]